MFAGLDDDAVRKIVRGNAIRMLHLDLTPDVSAPQSAYVTVDGAKWQVRLRMLTPAVPGAP